MKKGISLITLIITILIVIILSSVIILSLSKSNVVGAANEARFKSDVDTFKSELANWISGEYIKNASSFDAGSINATKTGGSYKNLKMTDIIKSMPPNYVDMFEIRNGELVYVGEDATVETWCSSNSLTANSVYTDIVTDGATTYAVLNDKTVVGWGDNSNYQLSDKTQVGRSVPIKIQGLSNVKKIIPMYYEVYALLNDGTVMAWGDNKHGQLGDNSSSVKMTPTIVPNLSNVSDIFCDGSTAYALLNDGTVKLAGYNGATDSYTNGFTSIQGLTNVVQLIAEGSNCYALLSTGKVMAWGDNQFGQLGDGNNSLEDIYTPKEVTGLSNVKKIFSNSHSVYALLDTDKVMAWGDNEFGQLGDGTTENRNIPVEVKELQNVKDVVLGNSNAYAILEDKTVKSWGKNDSGVLGNNTAVTYSTIPTYVVGLNNVKNIFAFTSTSTYALLEDGTMKSWGDNRDGQLGNGTTTNSSIPVNISSLNSIKKISIGYNYVCVLLNDGKVMSWGNNEYGQLGDGTTVNKSAPTSISNKLMNIENIQDINIGFNNFVFATTSTGKTMSWGHGAFELGEAYNKNIYKNVPELSNVKEFIYGDGFLLILLNDGRVMAWGDNEHGQLGDGTNVNKYDPFLIEGLSNVKKIVVGWGKSSYAILEDGKIMAWGSNEYGQLGDGTNVDKYIPTQVNNITDAKDLVVQFDSAYAMLNSGAVKVWGSNSLKQLGDGTSEDKYSPVTIEGLNNIKSITTSNGYIYALSTDGTIKVWGSGFSNSYSGIANLYNISTPTLIPDLNNVKEIITGNNCIYTLLNDGTVKTWGQNYIAQLGIGTYDDKDIPTKINGLENVKNIYVGKYSTYALLNDGRIVAWGCNDYGELGDETKVTKTAPVYMSGVSNVKEIYLGDQSIYITINDGSIKACGQNYYGVLGLDKKYLYVATATTIPNLTNVKKVEYGFEYAVILLENGKVQTYGDTFSTPD